MPIFVQYVLAFIGVLFACSYGYGQIREGKNQSKIDTITILKADVETLGEKVKELTRKVEDLTLEIEQKDKKLAATLEILQGRDPAMGDFIKASSAYMLSTAPTLDTLKRYLDKQVI